MSKPTIEIVLDNKTVLRLSPVPMSAIPSSNPFDWNRFQGCHVGGTQMSDEELNRLQGFMRRHNTEAVTDEKANYTVAGNRLAHCFPEKFPPNPETGPSIINEV